MAYFKNGEKDKAIEQYELLKDLDREKASELLRNVESSKTAAIA